MTDAATGVNAHRAAQFVATWCGANDCVALRRDAAGRYSSITALPDWFERCLARPDRSATYGLHIRSAFFEHALADSARFFDAADHSHAHDCGIWQETHNGISEHFQAHALRHAGQRMFTVQRLGAEFRRQRDRIQSARNQLLSNELLEDEVRARTADIRNREEQIALRLLYAVGARDKETGAHVRRIGLYAAVMAQAVDWPGAQVDDIRVAAPMHDIGKIGIPDAILQKPARLTAPEWELMRQHTTIGADMLSSDIPLLNMAADIARHHHEHWDGSGYPDALAGEQIPASARMVAIADVYDALVHARVYKPAWDESGVLDELQRGAGSHFDPQLLQVFIDNLDAMRAIRRDNPDDHG